MKRYQLIHARYEGNGRFFKEVIAEYDTAQEAAAAEDYYRNKVYNLSLAQRCTEDLFVNDTQPQAEPCATAEIEGNLYKHSIYGTGEIIEIKGDCAFVRFADKVRKMSVSFAQNK